MHGTCFTVALAASDWQAERESSKVGPGPIVPLKQIEYGVYGDLIIIYPKPYSIYLRGTICQSREERGGRDMA